MKFKFHQHIFLLAVFVLCALPFAALADGPTPQTANEHFAEGNKFYRANNKDKAIFHYSESIKMRDNAPAYVMRGTVYSLNKDYDKALADLNKAIQIDPQEYAAYFRRSDVYGLLGKNDLAEADKKEGIRIFRAKPAPRTARDYYDRGVYFDERAFWGDAINQYSEAAKLDPEVKLGFPFTSVYEKRGDLYGLTQKYNEAVDDYTRAIAARPQSVDLLLKRADVLADPFVFLSRKDEAIRDYSAVIARAADLKWVPEKLQHAYEQRMYLYGKRGEYDKAIADCTELLKLNPQNAHFFFTRGNFQGDKKDYEKAVRDYDQAILLDPKQEGYYNSRGVAYHNLKMYDKAITDYGKAIELYPKSFWPYYNRGLIYDSQKDWPKAAADFGKALEVQPKNTNSLNNRAVAYINLKEWDKALADLNRAIEIDPKFVIAYKNRAVVYRQQDKIAEAEADEKKVKELSP